MNLLKDIELKDEKSKYTWATSTETIDAMETFLTDIDSKIPPNIFASAWMVSWFPQNYDDTIIPSAQKVCFLYKFLSNTEDENTSDLKNCFKIALDTYHSTFKSWKNKEENLIFEEVCRHYKQVMSTDTEKNKTDDIEYFENFIKTHEKGGDTVLEKLKSEINSLKEKGEDEEDKFTFWELLKQQLKQSPPELLFFNMIMNEIKEKTLLILPKETDIREKYISVWKTDKEEYELKDLLTLATLQIETLLQFHDNDENKEWLNDIKTKFNSIDDKLANNFESFARHCIHSISKIQEEIKEIITKYEAEKQTDKTEEVTEEVTEEKA
tara:strand:- start:3667 stop:4641 length:975 start_codon:yes stop_codon:yes gene_type:complete